MPKSGRKAKSKQGTHTYHEQNHPARMVDELSSIAKEYLEFRDELLPALRRDMLNTNLTTKQLRERYAKMVQARVINIALTDENSGTALTAAERVLDRHEGKAKERLEHTHRLAELPDEELEAMIQSQLLSPRPKGE